MKTIFITVALVISAFFLGFYIKATSLSLGTIDVPFNTVTTGSATTATNTITSVISANTGRSYLLITNDSATTTYLGLQATSTGVVTNTGLRLGAGASYEIRDVNLYQGQIWAATSSNPLKILYIER
jgi:hypothetical protein